MSIYQKVLSGLFQRSLITTVLCCWYVKQVPGVFMEMLVAAPSLESQGPLMLYDVHL